jgi:hypothetical protein
MHIKYSFQFVPVVYLDCLGFFFFWGGRGAEEANTEGVRLTRGSRGMLQKHFEI